MTHLKLMIDHTFGEPVAEALNALGAVKARTISGYGFKDSEEDAVLIKATSDIGCLLLTHDHNTINQYRYPPCTHGGIIIIKGKHWSTETIHARIRALCLSGKKSLTAHSVTHLYSDRAAIHTHDGEINVLFK